MLDALRDAGRFEDEISDYGLRRIAEAWAHLHHFARGFETIEAMRELRQRAEGLMSLGRIAVGAQDSHLARDIAARALAQARFIDFEDIYNSMETLLSAAEFAWKVGLHAEALDVVREALMGDCGRLGILARRGCHEALRICVHLALFRSAGQQHVGANRQGNAGCMALPNGLRLSADFA